MPSTIACNFGDVVLVPFPFTDRTAVKKRPAVVISSAAYHRQRVDVVVMAVTSRTSPAAATLGEVIVVEWEKAGLLRPSIVKPVLATLERRLITVTVIADDDTQPFEVTAQEESELLEAIAGVERGETVRAEDLLERLRP